MNAKKTLYLSISLLLSSPIVASEGQAASVLSEKALLVRKKLSEVIKPAVTPKNTVIRQARLLGLGGLTLQHSAILSSEEGANELRMWINPTLERELNLEEQNKTLPKDQQKVMPLAKCYENLDYMRSSIFMDQLTTEELQLVKVWRASSQGRRERLEIQKMAKEANVIVPSAQMLIEKKQSLVAFKSLLGIFPAMWQEFARISEEMRVEAEGKDNIEKLNNAIDRNRRLYMPRYKALIAQLKDNEVEVTGKRKQEIDAIPEYQAGLVTELRTLIQKEEEKAIEAARKILAARTSSLNTLDSSVMNVLELKKAKEAAEKLANK